MKAVIVKTGAAGGNLLPHHHFWIFKKRNQKHSLAVQGRIGDLDMVKSILSSFNIQIVEERTLNHTESFEDAGIKL